MADSLFRNSAEIETIARTLFYGWTYGQYQQRNRLREDDQLVRSEAGHLISASRKSLDAAERAYRREFLPPPSRVKPRPDPQAVEGARSIERIVNALGAIQGDLAIHPIPEADHVYRRFDQGSPSFPLLVQVDYQVIGIAELFRTTVDGKTGVWLIQNQPLLEEGLAALSDAIRQRHRLHATL
jgi:hypothetical protein